MLTSCLHRITLTTLRGMHREPAIGEKLCVDEVHRVLGVPMGQLVDSGEMLPELLGGLPDGIYKWSVGSMSL